MPTRSPKRPIHGSAPAAAAEPVPPVVDPTAPDTPAPPHCSPNPSERRRIATWPIAGLKPHHLQDVTFHDLAGEEFVRFVESLRRGLDVPIEITPDGTIIDGHQRVRAAKELGWVEITVWVRDDIADDQAAIDRRHLDANRDRRQLDPLDKVRLARRLAEMELGRPPGGLFDREAKALCSGVAKQMGLSSRHAQRLLSISRLPMPIQRAYAAGRITLVSADMVSRLSWRNLAQIVGEIEAGGDPAKIIAPYLAPLKRPIKADDAFERLMAEVARGLDSLEGCEDQIRRSILDVGADLQLMDRFSRFHQVLAPILTRRLEKFDHDERELMASLGLGDNAHELDETVA
jgi:hypothetical protein